MRKDLFYQPTPAADAGRYLLASALRPGAVAPVRHISFWIYFFLPRHFLDDMFGDVRYTLSV